MTGPLVKILIVTALAALAVVLWWPGIGVLRGRGRRRSTARRVELEDALKHLYHADQHATPATLNSVAGLLQIPLARTVDLVERMQHAGLASLHRGRLTLTAAGRRYALQVIRAHRLWERYLADETGIGATEWHAEAERREHSMTPEEADALAQRLGDPRFDPHGDPIPTADGAVPYGPRALLSELDEGAQAHVVHIEDEPEVVYAQLVALGVYLGMVLRVEEKTPSRLVIEADGRRFALAPLLAANISVERLVQAPAVATEAWGSLVELREPGRVVEVTRISPVCRGLERRRLMDLGIVPGTRVAFERDGLTGGLAAYRVRGTVVALRDEQAALISVVPVADKGVAS